VSRIRLVTVNLYDGRVVPRDLHRFLAETVPDVVCAQEVGHNAARILGRMFEHGSLQPAFHWTGRALVSHAPIDVAPLALPYRGGYRGVLRPAGVAPVEILNVHLANPLDLPRGPAARRRQVRALEAILAVPARRVLVGDLNSTPAWPAYRRLTRHLDDGVARWAEREGIRPARTWAKWRGWPPLLRIDHVLTSGVSVVAARTHTIRGLDHRALVVDLETDGA
jgi:endonuclease/exonuclease/phosphatase family metal-dependent hydrolase